MSNNKLRVFEGFAGIGAVSKAIERLGIPHELVGFSEIDKYAIKSFCAVHGVDESLNWGDVCKIDETKLPDMDLYTFGSPCQDFSVAGKQKGSTWTCNDCGHEYNPLDVHWSKRDNCPNCNNKNINKSRSSLVVEALRIIRHKKPKYLLMENVKNLVGKQFKPSFDKIIAELNEYGYNTYWDVLNAKQYGVPQNRERVFVISIRKDIDTGLYKFPKGFDSGLRLKDILEEKVAEKYYLKKALNPVFTDNYIQYDNSGKGYNSQASRLYYTDSLMGSLPHSNGGDKTQIICADKKELLIEKEDVAPSPELIGGIGEINFGKQYRQGNRVYSSDKTAMCLLSQPVGNAGGQSYLYAVPQGDKENNKDYLSKSIDKIIEKNNGEIPEAWDLYNKNHINSGMAKTLSCGCGRTGTAGSTAVTDSYRIRKLTPLECWRLMGFDDNDFIKAKESGVSDTQLYKQAGNSIVVNCLEYMFKELFITSVKSLHNIG